MDVDIDCIGSFDPATVFPNWVKASIVNNGELTPHPCGYYPQAMASDPLTKLAAIPYKEAEELEYLKVDFLHNTIYNHFQSKEEIDALLELEPEWKLLLIPSVQQTLFQLAKHGELLTKIKPTSIEELADILALIRPGKKEYLGLYLKNKAQARKLLYAETAKYYFKRSHAISYALVIVLQLHLISAGLM